MITAALLTGCGRFEKKDKTSSTNNRIVCISKQYNEIIWELGAEQNIVGVDLSSIYPPAVQKLPTVGYHRDLSVEGILSLKPDLIIHDNNVGPESVMRQISELKIPIKSFAKDTTNTIEGTEALIHEIGAYFHREHEADSLCKILDSQMNTALENAKLYTDTPKVAILHYGRIGAGKFLLMTSHSTAAKIVNWAGGKIAMSSEKGMMPLSAEVFSQSNPDIILVTDFGFDKLGGEEKIMELPGVAETNAAKNHRIYKVWEQDLVYLGPRTGQIILNYQKLLHGNASAQ